MEQKQLQEKAVMYQLLQQQLQQLNEQSVLLERKSVELELSREVLNDIKKMKTGKDMLVPLGGELFTYGKVTDPNSIMVNIGAGVMTKSDTKNAAELIEKKIAEIQKLQETLQHDSSHIIKKINEIANEIEQAQKK